ncbi:hypothetical protein GTW46_27625, partial [Streptomyces sp. SID6013]|nr:hypothetical protein [Streptomyces sp. SID6013]
IPRKRISLTLRLDDEAAPQGEPKKERGGRPPRQRQQQQRQGGAGGGKGRPASAAAPSNGAMADALRRAGLA